MKLNFKPAHNHFKNAIEGAVSQCCTAIIEKMKEKGVTRINLFENGFKILGVFTDGCGTYRDEYICELEYQPDCENIVVIGDDGWNGSFTAKGGDGYFLIAEVIGDIYEAVCNLC